MSAGSSGFPVAIQGYVLLLRWADGTDLADLDHRVATGQHTDADFDSCVSAYVGSRRCRHCGERTTAVLPDPGTPPSSPERARQHRSRNECPHCGHLTLSYFELIG